MRLRKPSFIDRPLADAIRGDLEEERRRRARQSSPATARLWVWRAWLGILFTAIWHRVADAAEGGRRSGWFGPAHEWRQAARGLRRTPWYAASGVGVIALSLTLTTTVFAVVDGVLFKPLPFRDPSRLVVIEPGHHDLPNRFGMDLASPDDLAEWRAALPDVVLTSVSSGHGNAMPLGLAVNAPLATIAHVGEGFLEVLGVRPIIGGFRATDFESTTSAVPRAALLTYDLWHADFSGDPSVVGRVIVLQQSPPVSIQVVGVLPRDFTFPAPFDAQVLVAAVRTSNPAVRQHPEVVARLPQGMTADVLRTRIEAAMATAPPRPVDPRAVNWAGTRFAGVYAPFDSVAVVPLGTYVDAMTAPLATAVFAAAVLLLVLGGINVSGLVAARCEQRTREVALRRALGADGGAIVRYVFAEVALIAAIGGAIGLVAARPILSVTAALLPPTFHPFKTLTVDWRVAGFSATLMAAGALLMTIAPARRALRNRTGLQAGDAHVATERVSRRTHAGTAVQVALGMVLAVGGALVVGSLIRVWTENVGFDRDVMAVTLQLGRPPSRGGAADVAMMLDRVRHIRGVGSAAVTAAPLLTGASVVAGIPTDPPPSVPKNDIIDDPVTSEFFDVMRPALIAGRYPTAGELDDGSVLVVSESVARAYWPAMSAIGQTLTAANHAYIVVGVVGDARYETWDSEIGTIYGPFARLAGRNTATLLVHGLNGADPPMGDVLSAIATMGSALRASRVNSINELLGESIRDRRFDAWLFGAFAASALLILATGLFGLVAMTSARRTREVGVRMALGATRDGVMAWLVGETLPAVVIGILSGGVMAVWAARFLKAYLYELGVYDARIWFAAVAALLVASLGGAVIPAARASRADPVRALRVD